MFYPYRYLHEIRETARHGIVLVDVCYTPDKKWESAYHTFDEKAFRDWWGDDPYTIKDAFNYGTSADAFSERIVIGSRDDTPVVAEKKLNEFIATL